MSSVFRERAIAGAFLESAASHTATVTDWGDVRRLPVRKPNAPADAYKRASISRSEALTLVPGEQASIAGDKDVALQFSVPIRGASDDPDQTGGNANGIMGEEDPEAIVNYFRDLLRAGGWAQIPVAPRTVTTSATTTSIPLSEKQYLFPGVSFIAIKKPNTNILEVRRVTANATWDVSGAAAVTVAPAFSFTPADGAAVYGGLSFLYAEDRDNPASFELLDYLKGDSIHQATGCRTALSKIEVKPGEAILADFSVAGLDWNTENSSGTDLLSAITGTIPTMAEPTPILGNDTKFFFNGVSKTIAGATVDFAPEWSPVIAADVNGKSGHVLSNAAPTMTIPTYPDGAYGTAFNGSTTQPVWVQFGNAPGSTVIVYFPAGRVEEFPGKKEVNKLVGQELKIKGTVSEWADTDMIATLGPQCPTAMIFLF